MRAGALGDVLLLRRAIAALHDAGHRVGLVAPEAGAVLVGGGGSELERHWPWHGPEIARLLAGENAEGPISDALHKADAVVAYTRSPSAVAALRACARRLLVHDPSPPVGGPHASDWLLQPLRELDISSTPNPPALAFSAGERADAEPLLARLPARFLAIHPGSGSPTKNWPSDRFQALAGRLSPDGPVLLVLGPAEQTLSLPTLPSAPPAPSWIAARNLPLRVLGAVLSRADLFVGNDSGVAHLASAAGAPTLALFGPTDPVCWAPVGRVVRCLRAPGKLLAELGVDAVYDAASQLHGPPAR